MNYFELIEESQLKSTPGCNLLCKTDLLLSFLFN